MRAVILAGGRGTRLLPFTTVLPKPLVPVGEKPILELIIQQLARRGFTEVDLAVGHLGELIRAYLDEGAAIPDGVSIRYHWEDSPLGTAGALRHVGAFNGPALVMNGDILTTIDYQRLVAFHSQQEAALTIATHSQTVRLELGVVEKDESVVTGYVEKPTLAYEVSMGIYVFSPQVLDHIPPQRFDFPDLVLALLGAGERVAAFHFDGPWFDIGTPGEHERAVAAFDENPALFEPKGSD